jgi:hypothetical protein
MISDGRLGSDQCIILTPPLARGGEAHCVAIVGGEPRMGGEIAGDVADVVPSITSRCRLKEIVLRFLVMGSACMS